MSAETQEVQTIQPVRGKDGKIVPGLFCFDSLPRNRAKEADIARFTHDIRHQRELQKIDESIER